MTIPTLLKIKLRSGKAKLLSGLEEVAELVFSLRSDFVTCIVPTVPTVFRLLNFMEQKYFQTNWGRRATYIKLPVIHFAYAYTYGYSKTPQPTKLPSTFTTIVRK